jgi:ketosteroid isomerase-like protein
MLHLVEVDAAGRRVALVTFDLCDLDAAYTELDERYAAGEAAPHAGTWEILQRFMRTVASRDWEQMASIYTDDFVYEDHRLLGWGTRSRDEALAQFPAMTELASDARLRSDHTLAINRRGILNVARWMGSRDGGVFEIPMVGVILFAPDGRFRRTHSYDLDQLDAARACFDTLTSEPPALRIETAATRAADRASEAWAARDWKRMAELFPAGFRCSDRRRLMQLELDRDQFLEWTRTTFGMSSSRLEQQVLATRGDRLALSRDRVEVADQNLGPSEIESLSIIEVGEHGEPVATVRFDPDDLSSAYAELDARYAAGEGASRDLRAAPAELRPDPLRIPPNAATRAGDRHAEALVARDWDALRELADAGFRYEDRSRWALVSGDCEMWIASLKFLVSESGARVEHEILGTVGDRIALYHTAWSGASDATRFELDRLRITEVNAEGKLLALILFDVEDRHAAFDEAQARFVAGEAAATGGQAPLLEFSRALAQRDREATREALAPDFVHHDRRRLVSGTYDRDQYVESLWTMRDLAPNTALEEWRILAWDRHGRVAVGRSFGTTRDGVVFENVMVCVALTRGDRIQQLEFFDLGDSDRALARFDELCTARIDTRRESP